MSTTTLVTPSTFDENAQKYISCWHIKWRTGLFCIMIKVQNINQLRRLLFSIGHIDFWGLHTLFFNVIEIAILIYIIAGIRYTKSIYLVPAICYLFAYVIGTACLIPLAFAAEYPNPTILGNQTIAFLRPMFDTKTICDDDLLGTERFILLFKFLEYLGGLYLTFKCFKFIRDKENHEKNEGIFHLIRDAEPL